LQLQHLQESKSLIISELKDKQKQDELKFISTKSELLHLISDTKKDINLTTKKIQDAKSIQDTCPTCGRKFDNVFIPDTVADENLLKELQKQLITYNEQLNKLTNEYDDFVDRCDIEIKNNTLEIDNKIKELQAHLFNYNSSMSSTRREKAEEERNLQKYEQLKLNFDVTVKTLTDSIRSNEEDIKNFEQEVVYNSVSKENLSDRVAIINKFILMTTRDFRGHLLKNVIKYIDDKAKDYCEEVFGTRELDFILSGNNIDIKYCGKYMESLSGGEKQKIDLIIQFSIRDMLCQFLDFRSNIIALDEIFDALDSVSCDKVVNLISKGLSDIDSVFIITHHKELGIPADNIITVTKQADGVSTVI
jgi:DNA repair exonuclease SbcCD ATPase subunit